MTVLISPKELLAIDHYLGQAKNNQLQGQLQYAVYSQEELVFIFPAIRKLLSYGVQENEKLAKHAIRYNYAYMRRGSKNNPRHIFMLVLTYTQVLADLLSMYKLAVAREQTNETKAAFFARKELKDWLFSLTIDEMSPGEYAQFRSLIGR
ncbi:hypothetical protein [Spirosoma pollinicola]|uniref:Uncharacterized protein n=1 Tax=Spirosoma pollinicola TaxID=2057025 RepID=A0A2K8YV08_9BACT|nr:hypothetical protein [Spirosoma pollinicola]AUD01453.1 hypothetical protein CWM47_06285 [Spirosoma pollinicola]